MPVACVIPARYGSTRFPGKLLIKAKGRTILQRTFEQVSACPLLSDISVATDDERIAEHAREFGARVIWTSASCVNGTERIAEAVAKDPILQKASILLNAQGDHPAIAAETISAVVEALRSDPGASISTAVCASDEELSSPHRVKCVFDQRGNALYFSRAPIPYKGTKYLHIGIYAYRPEALALLKNHPSTPLQMAEDLEQLKVLELGHRIKVAIVSEVPIGIDTPEDLQLFEKML